MEGKEAGFLGALIHFVLLQVTAGHPGGLQRRLSLTEHQKMRCLPGREMGVGRGGGSPGRRPSLCSGLEVGKEGMCGHPCGRSEEHRGGSDRPVRPRPSDPRPLLYTADPTQDTELELDGQQVAVAQGRPTLCPEFSRSAFSQSEYLIYQESQCCLRYLLEVRL